MPKRVRVFGRFWHWVCVFTGIQEAFCRKHHNGVGVRRLHQIGYSEHLVECPLCEITYPIHR